MFQNGVERPDGYSSRIWRNKVIPLMIAIVVTAAAVIGFIVHREQPGFSKLKPSGNMAFLQVDIALKTSGLITALLTDEGRDIKAGDVILKTERIKGESGIQL